MTSISYLLVTITVLVMGVFSATTPRRLNATGQIEFIPDLRAAVKIEFKIENAWRLNEYEPNEYEPEEVPNTEHTIKNYVENIGKNPTINSSFTGDGLPDGMIIDGMIIYDNLIFNPETLNIIGTDSEITLTLKITNNSATETDMQTTFTEAADNEIKTTGTPIKYTLTGITAGTPLSIAQKETKTITIKFNLLNIEGLSDFLDFKFAFEFGFESED